MPLTLANVSLVSPTAAIREWIGKNISATSFMPWQRVKWPSSIALANLTTSFGEFPDQGIEINKFIYPSGASRWGYGHFLATDTIIQKITDKVGWNTIDLNDVLLHMDTPGLMSANDETNWSGSKGMDTMVFVLPPTPLSGMPTNITKDANNIYLLTVVDERYFWWYRDTGDLIVNSDSIPNWEELYQNLGDKIGVTIIVDPIDSAYLQPSPDFNLNYAPIPPVLDAVAFNVGQRLFRGLSGKIYARNYRTSLKTLNNQFTNTPKRTIRAGWMRMPSSYPPYVNDPFFGWQDANNCVNISEIAINFKGWKCPDKKIGTYPASYISKWKNPTMSETPLHKFTLTIESNCKAYYDPSDTSSPLQPMNKEQLDKLTAMFAEQLISWKQTSFDIVINGIVNADSNGLVDTIEFAYLDDDAYTRIYSYPWNYDPIQLCHYNWANECKKVGNRFIAPEDIPPGKNLLCQTYVLNNSGMWTSAGKAIIYNPMSAAKFSAGDVGVAIVDVDGNMVAVCEECSGQQLYAYK